MSKKIATIDDIVGITESQAERAVNLGIPFETRHFLYEDVVEALDELRSAGKFADLELYDIKGTIGIWRRNGEPNYPLARKATRQLIRTIQDKNPGLPLEQILPMMTEQVFWHRKINRFGTTLCSMLNNVYFNSPFGAIKSLIDADADFESFRDLEPYDMLQAPKNAWNKKNGRKNYALARRATKALIYALRKERKIPFGKVLASIGIDDFRHTPINKYGTTLAGMISSVYEDSPFAAVKDLIDHCYALKGYRDFSPTDMRQSPLNSWTKDGECNYALAREQMKKCFESLARIHPGFSRNELVLRLNRDAFVKTPINRYGATVEGMIKSIYSSLCEALRDLAEHDEAYQDLLPAIEVRRLRKANGQTYL